MKPDRPTYLLRLRPEPGVNAIRALRRLLKFALRQCKMKAISIDQERAASKRGAE